MDLAGIHIASPFVAAPMAGVTSPPFRVMAKAGGASLVYSEMVSAAGLARGLPKTWALCRILEEERPIGIQLFGGDPRIMGEAAAKLQSVAPDLIDINLGCPARKVRKNRAGSALAAEPGLAAEVVAAVVENSSVPVTVKVRLGYSGNELARLVPGLVAAGAGAVCLHARTVAQGFSGRADWRAIAELKSWCPLPVIGNGDVTSAACAVGMLGETGCDAVMIGRAAMGDPWIFGRAEARLAGREAPKLPAAARREALWRHMELARTLGGDGPALHFARRFMMWYSKGLPGASAFRAQAGPLKELDKLLDVCEKFFDSLEEAGL